MQGGFRLPGMVNFDKNASTGLEPTERLSKLLVEIGPILGCVKITVSEKNIDGKKLFNNPRIKRSFNEKLSALSRHISEEEPSIFVCYRNDKDALLVTYVPEQIKPKMKMLYAGSKSTLKNAVQKADEGCLVEEYNVTSPAELDSKVYNKRHDATEPKPYTEEEIYRQEQAQLETAGGYGFLANLKKQQGGAFVLPGLGMKPSEMKAMNAKQKEAPKEEVKADEE